MRTKQELSYMLDDEIWSETREVRRELRDPFVRISERIYRMMESNAGLAMDEQPIVHEVIWAVAFVRSIYD